MSEFKDILRENNFSGREMADALGLTYSSYRSMLSRGSSGKAPRWMKAFMIGYGWGENSGRENALEEAKKNSTLRVDGISGCADSGPEFKAVCECGSPGFLMDRQTKDCVCVNCGAELDISLKKKN